MQVLLPERPTYLVAVSWVDGLPDAHQPILSFRLQDQCDPAGGRHGDLCQHTCCRYFLDSTAHYPHHGSKGLDRCKDLPSGVPLSVLLELRGP